MDGFNLRLDRGALERMVQGPDGQKLMRLVGEDIRDRARINARVITDKTGAIISQVGVDTQSVYVDIGYDKHHPGFFLWWWEVGTKNHPPRPHLRPALRPRS